MGTIGVGLLGCGVVGAETARRLLVDGAARGMSLTGIAIADPAKCRPDDMTAIAVEDGGAVLAHVGDTKAVLVRSGTATVLTEAQTIAARMVRMGELPPEALATHPKRATLYQIIGQATRLDVERVLVDVAVGDRVVLSTDGLDYADSERVAKLLAGDLSPADLAEALIAAAIDGGGRDNITAVVADVVP